MEPARFHQKLYTIGEKIYSLRSNTCNGRIVTGRPAENKFQREKLSIVFGLNLNDSQGVMGAGCPHIEESRLKKRVGKLCFNDDFSSGHDCQ
jgi:hypothetical protein